MGRFVLALMLSSAALATPVAVIETSFDAWPAGLAPVRDYPPEAITVADGGLRIDDDDDTAYYGAGWTLGLPLPAEYRLQWRQRMPADGYGGLILGGEREVVHVGIGQADDDDDFLLETGPDAATHPYRTMHPLGPREAWHAFDLRVAGERLRLAVDGREVIDRAFSGAPVTAFWFWSGQRSVGVTEVDDVRLTAELPRAAADRLDIDFGQPDAMAGWQDHGGVIGGLGAALAEPDAGYFIDFRQQPKWTLTSPLFTLEPRRSYRLALSFRARNQPMSFEVTVAAAGSPRPLANLTSRETRDQLRELTVDFPSGAEALTAGVVIRSTGGGGTLTLQRLTVEPLAALVDSYTTGYGLLPPTLGSVGGRLGRMVQAEDAAIEPPAADLDGDGRWGLARLDEDADRHYFAGRTVLKSESKGGGPLVLKFSDLKPGRYRAILSDPCRPATITLDERTIEAPGAKGEVELGVVTMPAEVTITPAAPEPGNPGPVYVDYVRFLPVYDPAESLHAPVSQPTPRLDAAPVILTLRGLGGRDGQALPIVTGVPLPIGYLKGFTGTRPVWSDRRILLLTPLASWRDGSVKWLRVYVNQVTAAETRVLSFDPRRVSEKMLDMIWTRGPAGGDGLRAILPNTMPGAPPKLVVDCGQGPIAVPLEAGTVRGENESDGRIIRRWAQTVDVMGLPALEVVVRGEFRWGAESCGLTVSVINASGKPIDLRRAELVIPVAKGDGPTETLTAEAGRLLLNGSPRAAEDGWLAMRAGERRIGFGLRDMARRFPCAIRAEPTHGRVTFGLWTGDQPYSFDPGSSLTHHLALADPDVVDGRDRLSSEMAQWLQPVEVSLDPAWLCSTGAFGTITPAGTDPRFADFEQQVRRSFDVICRERSEDGMESFGGVFQPGGYIAGTERMWTNMEYDFVHSTLTQYARTGERDYFERARQAAQHFVDVDLIRWHSDPLRIGGSFVHSHSMKVGHHNEGPNFGHGGWPQGLLWAYYLTGDRDLYDGAIGLGDYILKNLPAPEKLATVTPKYAMSEERDAGNALLTLATVYEATGDPRYLDGARQVFDYVWRTQEPGLGAWGTTIHEYPPHRGSTFMIVMLYRALAAYYEVSGDPRVGEVMRAHTPWLLTAARDEQGRYPHKEWPPTSRSQGSFPYYAEGYALAAQFAEEPERSRLLDLAVGDLIDIYSTADRTCQMETDLDLAERGRYAVAGGAMGEWHEYVLDVDGATIRYEVDGQRAWSGEFSGRAVDEVRFWSGMNARGTMLVDHVRIDGAAEPGGRRELLLDHAGDTVEPFVAQPRSDQNRVEAGDGAMRFVDADETYLGAAWKLPRQVRSYRLVWRQRFEAGMYGGFNAYGGGKELIHVGLGQGRASQAPFTNPRAFAPAVANLARLIGADATLR